MWAYFYNVVWFAFLFKIWSTINALKRTEADADHPEYIKVIEVLFIAYNLIIHLPILPINFVIIFKEFTMEYFQFLGVAGSDSDDVSLGFNEFWKLWFAIFELFNPFWWFSDNDWIYY